MRGTSSSSARFSRSYMQLSQKPVSLVTMSATFSNNPRLIQHVLDNSSHSLTLLQTLACIKIFRPYVLEWWKGLVVIDIYGDVDYTDRLQVWRLLKYKILCNPHANDYLGHASYIADVALIRLMLKRGADVNDGLPGACQGGHIDIVDLMINNGATEWNNGLNRACFGGHRNIVERMIEKGANDWNGGLRSACEGGDRHIVDFMIEKGAGDWNAGLCGAACGVQRSMAELMIRKGATHTFLVLGIWPNILAS